MVIGGADAHRGNPGVSTTVEAGSIRGAAKKLGVTQPALTKTLRNLETRLGAPLMLRSVGGVTPTQYGRALIPRATLITEEFLRASEELSQMSGHRGGYVTIGISPVVSLFLGASALSRLWQHHPLANIHIVHGQYEYLVAGIQEGKLDFSMGPIPRASIDKRITIEPLFQHAIVPVVRQGHSLAKSRSLADLQKAEWIFRARITSSMTASRRIFSITACRPRAWRRAVNCFRR